MVAAAGIAVERIECWTNSMHYLGQTHTVACRCRHVTNCHTGITEAMIRTAFDEAYAAAFGRLLPALRCGSCHCAPPLSAAAPRSI